VPETIVRVTLPEMGESVTEGSIVEWRVKPGQWIDAGEPLLVDFPPLGMQPGVLGPRDPDSIDAPYED